MRDVGSKRKTKKAAQDRDLKKGNCKRVPITREQLAREAFELEFIEDYFEKHPDVKSLPEDEKRKMIEIFDQQVQMTHSKIVEEYHEKYPYLHLFETDPCFQVKFIELYQKSKKATSEIIEVNRDVAESSSKNTMNVNKRKTTTTQNSNSVKMRDVGSKRKTKKAAQDRDLKKGNCKRVPITREQLARVAFQLEFIEDYFEKHPDVKSLPEDEKRKMIEIFDQQVQMTHSKIVEEYHEKYPYLHLFETDPCFQVKFIELYQKSKKATSEIIEVNRDVAESSSKNTMNVNKRKTTTTQNSNSVKMRDVGSKRKTKKAAQDRDLKKGNCKRVPITREQLARVAFQLEFIEDYFEKHPDVKSLPEDEKRKMIEIFDQQVQMTHSKIVEEYHEKYPYLHLFETDPCFQVKFIELYQKSKKATSEIIEVNRDVAESSSKNTMNVNKRKTTTTQNSNSVKMRDVGSKRKTKKAAQDRDLKKGNCKRVPITREQLARVAFQLEFIEDYFEKHPDVKSLPEDEKRKMIEIFDQQVQMTHSKIVEEYHEKYPYLHLFETDPCFQVKFIELYQKSKKATSEIIEVNRDVAESSSKNTMNVNKRKTTTTQNSNSVKMRDVGSKRKTKKAAQDRDLKKGNCKRVRITREQLAREAFELEFIEDYFEKHPDVKSLPEDEKRKMIEIFDQQLQMAS